MFKKLKPIFIENSNIPSILSHIAPIDIWAINIGPFVWCKGYLSEQAKRHETIHFQQQLELLFVFNWILYLTFWIMNWFIYKDPKIAYYNICFEIEAYENENEKNYLIDRPRYNWKKYI